MDTPSWHPLEAPAHWRAIDVLSDLHLSPALPRTTQAFEAHLSATDADAVLILGDLFEVWIGDDQRYSTFEAHCLGVLAAAARNRWIGFMVGNRDFLLGPATLEPAGMHALGDPLLLKAFGQRYLLTHGDALCLDDVEYQRFRREVRQERWQREFLARPFDERAALAQHIREESRTRKAAIPNPADWADVNTTAAIFWLEASGAQVLVHGHTHRPQDHAMPGGRVRHVLSDWDLDGDAARAEVIRIAADGVRRITPKGPSNREQPLATPLHSAT